MTQERSPRTHALSDDEARRVRLTVSCDDCDSIPKVDGAGSVVACSGRALQVMHNGLLIEEGCYYGAWMTEVIRSLRGHHEPQEEVVFHHIIERLEGEVRPMMVEFGSHWAYYSMWFVKTLRDASAFCLEPDISYFDIGRRNAELNDLSERMTFIRGVVGPKPGVLSPFRNESDGQVGDRTQHDLASLMVEGNASRVDLLLADIQGAELTLLRLAESLFASGAVRFLVVSTHHHSISGSPTTHQEALEFLTALGAHVIAEHSVTESFSGDGLIAASFDPRDRDFTVAISHARAKQSLFGEVELDLSAAWNERDVARRERDEARGALAKAVEGSDELTNRLAQTIIDRDALRADLDGVYSSRSWRWLATPRAIVGRARALLRL